LARLGQAGWTAGLDEASADVLALSLLGLYKMLGVDLVGEQIESLFAVPPTSYELERHEIVLFFGTGMEMEVTYSLEKDPLPPHFARSAALDVPVLNAKQILLQGTQVEWSAWARAWEPDPLELRGGAVPAALRNVHVLGRT